jgi:LuxR family maltose regulon positive regulatory protein
VWAVHWSTATDAKQAIEAARKALPALAETHYYARGVLLLALTLSLQVNGQAALAEPMLAAALAQAELSTLGGAALLRPLLCLMSLHFAEGNIGIATQVAQILLRRATETNSWFDLQTAHLALGFAAYETNDLPAAIEHFRHGADLRHAGNVRAGHECLVGLVLSYHALRRTDAVKATLAQLADYHADVGSSMLAAEAISLQRRCGLLGAGSGGGDFRRRGVSVHMSIWFGWLEVPALTEVRLALAAGQGRNLAPVESALRQLWEVAVELNKPTYQVALLALKAVLQQQMGRKGAALETLRQALAIGEERGYVRSVVDAGPQLEPLLAELAILQPSAYLERVRAALDVRPKIQGGKESVTPITRVAIPLTRREREVLALLGQYRTDREIAETLVISPLTVRTHIENLSSKLSANGRRAIVNQAREKGLLA